MAEYEGDMILISRLSEWYSPDHDFQWNPGQPITLKDINQAINTGLSATTEIYGTHTDFFAVEPRDNSWHISRVLYFVKHPDEIKNIDIDCRCHEFDIYPEPIIIDGNHRFLAAQYLYSKGLLEKVHCRYGGREDLRKYLVGESNFCPTE